MFLYNCYHTNYNSVLIGRYKRLKVSENWVTDFFGITLLFIFDIFLKMDYALKKKLMNRIS